MTENKKIFKNNFKNPSWNFKTDIIHQYAFWNDFLSKDEVLYLGFIQTRIIHGYFVELQMLY